MIILSNITLRVVLLSTVVLVLGAWVLAITAADLKVNNLGFAAEVALIVTALVIGIGASYAFELLLRKTDGGGLSYQARESTTGVWLGCALFDALAVVVLIFVTASAAAIRCFV